VPFRPTEMRNGKLLTTSKGVRAMLLSRSVQRERKGALAPLLALLIIPILGMIAFSVDLGYLIATRTELQNAADAAAMAGAQQLMTPYAQSSPPGQPVAQQTLVYSNAFSPAKATAKAVSAFNTAGGVNIKLQDADVTIGYYDGVNFSASPSVWTAGVNF